MSDAASAPCASAPAAEAAGRTILVSTAKAAGASARRTPAEPTALTLTMNTCSWLQVAAAATA
jgi:hypothetical protein